MRAFKDLREFFQLLEGEKQLLRISEKVSLGARSGEIRDRADDPATATETLARRHHTFPALVRAGGLPPNSAISAGSDNE
jgi:3-polyprenyl-4-hydroxybenzoate decarboxylase